MKIASHPSLALVLFAAMACGPTVSGDPNGGNGVDGGATGIDAGPQTTETNCFDGRDDDGDGLMDCDDPDCDEACNPTDDTEECGEATHTGDPLAIPDGVGMSYATSLIISGFDPGQTLTDISGFLGACVTMEHSWLRDLHIELICPTGQIVVLQQFLGQTGSELYMGEPIDGDGFNPTPGVGYEYCWRPTATNAPMLEWSNANPGVGTLPSGDYQSSGPYTNLVGCGLNGAWTIRATDDWGSDNGFIFEWSLEFDSAIISDCEGWDVE
ncbi:MAG TPA: proprotein convertase P-domain-containing protein [Kofleriaceae bacterium]|nr:proprotein convertase P-domain-containing protein [Kofleriaceae bacterium]